MTRPKEVARALAEHSIEAPQAAATALAEHLKGRVLGVSRAQLGGDSGLLAVTDANAAFWSDPCAAAQELDLFRYSAVSVDGESISMGNPNVEQLDVDLGDAARVAGWLAVLSRFGISPDSSGMSASDMRKRIGELLPRPLMKHLDRFAARLAVELGADEVIEAAFPAKFVPTSGREEGLLVVTARRLVHVEESAKNQHTKSLPFVEMTSMTTGELQVGFGTVSLLNVACGGELHQFALGSDTAAQTARERLGILADERIPAMNRERARWWESVGLPAVNVARVEYYGGHPRAPREAKNLILKLSQTGMTASTGFRDLFSLSWGEVTGLTVEGADLVQRRVTMTRLLAVGIFAFAWKKKAYQQSYLAVETGDGEMIFAVDKKTPQQLRSQLTPYLSAMDAESSAGSGAPTQPAPQSDDPIELIRRLADLRDAGALSEAEFEEKKAEILKRI